jgi:hypothetical protein
MEKKIKEIWTSSPWKANKNCSTGHLKFENNIDFLAFLGMILNVKLEENYTFLISAPFFIKIMNIIRNFTLNSAFITREYWISLFSYYFVEKLTFSLDFSQKLEEFYQNFEQNGVRNNTN